MAARQCRGAHVGLKVSFPSGWLQQLVVWQCCSWLVCSSTEPIRVLDQPDLTSDNYLTGCKAGFFMAQQPV